MQIPIKNRVEAVKRVESTILLLIVVFKYPTTVRPTAINATVGAAAKLCGARKRRPSLLCCCPNFEEHDVQRRSDTGNPRMDGDNML